jgi:DNA-binding NarL/FixJ family response regulator
MEMVMFSITKANVSSLDPSPPQERRRSQAEPRPWMKILVVDEHFLIRDALCAVIKELKNDATVLEAADGRQTMQLVSEQRDIGLVLLELDLPDRDGMSVLRELRERHPAISVVVLSARQERASVAKALDLGAHGFIPKSGQREVMLSALNLVFAGGVYIPPEILSREERPDPNLKPMSAAELRLTKRQIDVLKLMMTGKSNKAICRALTLAEPTVKNHVTAIFKALKVTNRTEAVVIARDLDWEGVASGRFADVL